MVTQRSVVTARHDFLDVALADPELLDLAFAEVIASWEAEPPGPPDRTLVATSERRQPRLSEWRTGHDRRSGHAWVRTILRPSVARSPPERPLAGRS